MDDIQSSPNSGAAQERSTIFALPISPFSGFSDFLRERGVAGFAIGFIFGGASQTLVQALMNDIVNPLVGLLLGGTVKDLSAYTVGDFKFGDFISALINFLILCFVIYLIFKVLQLEKLDKPKS